MPDPVNTLELAQRLRRDADATNMPEYAFLMRRAAAELEGFSRIAGPALHSLERLAG